MTLVSIYDQETVFKDCTVQILSSSITGQTSVGWKINEEIKPGKWRSVDEEPPRGDCYIVLWKALEPTTPQERKVFYEIVWYDDDGVWHVGDDIPQAADKGGAEILYWMPLPEKPEEVRT